MRSRRLASVVLAAVSMLALSGCPSGDGTSPPENNGGTSDNTSRVPVAVSVSPSTDTLHFITATRQLAATVLNSSGGTVNTTVTWSTSSPAVATVSGSGLVTAAGPGTATISATAGSVSGSATIVVKPAPATITKQSGDGQTGTAGEILDQPLMVEVRDTGNTVVAGAALTWTVIAGDGTLETASAETDASGLGQASWRLGGAVGGQSVQVRSGAVGPVTFEATAVAPEVASVALTPQLDTLTAIGATLQYEAKAFAAGGAEIPSATFAYSVTNGAVASISATGLATAKAVGTTKVVAASGEKTDTATLVVSIPPTPLLTITGVSPSVLVEGQSATISGTGFAAAVAGNTVTLDGAAVTVTAASATLLTVTVPTSDCLPSRSGQLSVTVDAANASRTVSVTPATVTQLDAGFVTYGNTCVNLAAATGTQKYLVGILSTSEIPSSLTPATLSSTVGVAVGAPPELAAPAEQEGVVWGGLTGAAARPPLAAAAGVPLAAPVDGPSSVAPLSEARARAEASWRARERRTVEELRRRVGARRRPSPLRAPAQPVAVGDMLSLTVPGGNNLCTDGTVVQGVVKYVGTGGIWVEDVANPVEAFTAAEYQTLDDSYSSVTHPTITQYFGDFADYDGNGRTIILLTQEVNKTPNLLGFVFAGDLYPTGVCAGSNQGEIFYGLVPDPAGTLGTARTKDYVAGQYPALVAHEVTHVLQYTQSIFSNAAFRSTWEAEGGATLAEQLVGFQTLGHASGQNLGYAVWSANPSWYSNFISDLAAYFGYTQAGHVAHAPEQCSWMGRTTEGNSGPCSNLRAPYGVPATLLRFILDRYGPTYPGGEVALMRQLTGSRQYGLATLAGATGDSKELLLSLFGLTLWGDGTFTNGLTSWDLNDIFSHLVATARLQAYTSAASAPTLSVSVRAGSNAYLEWSPAAGHPPTSLKIRTAEGGALPSNMTLWVWRYQ